MGSFCSLFSHSRGPWPHVGGIKVTLTRLWLFLQSKSQAWPSAFSLWLPIWQHNFLLPSRFLSLRCCLPRALLALCCLDFLQKKLAFDILLWWVNTAGVHYNNTKQTQASRYIKDKLLKLKKKEKLLQVAVETQLITYKGTMTLMTSHFSQKP